MSGYEDLKRAFTNIARDREARQNKIYMAKVVSVEPLKISNNYFGILDKSQVSCLLYTSPSPRDRTRSRMPSSA